MLKLVRHCHKRTVLTETVLVISISVCTNSTLYRNSAGTSRKCLVYPEFLVNSICIQWTPLYTVASECSTTQYADITLVLLLLKPNKS